MNDVEMCCLCRVAQIEVDVDADYDVETGTYIDCSTIETPGAVDGREVAHGKHSIYDSRCFICAGCAAKVAA